jgi:hypothetical protein
MNPSTMTMLVWDYGSQVKFAQKMAETFQRVYYYNPSVHDGFEEVRDVEIGSGVDPVIKIKSWASVIKDIDIVAFTDCYEPEVQNYFMDLDIPVFGSRNSSLLETDRVYLKQAMEGLGLPMGNYDIADGVDYLEVLLREKEDVFIKSNHRGNHETTHWKNYRLSKGEIRRMKKDMGIFSGNERYIIEEKIDGIAEIGIDTFCIDGRYPSNVLTGIEVKDLGYVGCFMSYGDLPKQLRNVTEKMSPLFADLGYRGAHSNEVIIGKDREGYLIDLTQRLPQPPGDAMANAITNYAECVAMVANGIVPIVRNEYKYVCQFILKSDIAEIDDTPIIVPDQYKKFVSVKNLWVDPEGTWYYCRRGMKMNEIGSVCGYGDTLKQAIDMATEIANSIECEDACCDLGSINSGLESLKDIAKAGIKYFL